VDVATVGAAKAMARLITPALILLLILICWMSLASGSTQTPVVTGLTDWVMGRATLEGTIIGEIRLARTLIAVTVGAALGLAGAALQGLLRNPLADPSLTGASQGAALGAASVFYFGLFPAAGAFAPAFAGLIGAGAALLLMLYLAGPSRQAMVIMAGLAISTLAGAALATVLNFAPNPYAMQELVFWLLGSVSERGLDHLLLLGPALLIGGTIIWSQRRLLASLSLGEQVAQSLGFAYKRGSRLIILGTAILVGTAVAVAGNIGFVGLMVPHLLRSAVGHRPDRLLIPSALAGGSLVCLADIFVRMMPPGREIKLGVLTSLIGAPVFIWLVWRERRQWL
jgi:iron complex transport system permease protein